jgi:hypothetical protein
MPTILASFNRPAWASQERWTNLGNNNFAYRLTSGVHNLLAKFWHSVVGFSVTNHAYNFLFLGYPPPDHAVRDFLTKNGSKDESYHRACCFIDALFQHTDSTLRDLFPPRYRIDEVALQFRNLMTTGQKVKEHNEFRRTFYDQVVRMAEKFVAQSVSLLFLGCNSH